MYQDNDESRPDRQEEQRVDASEGPRDDGSDNRNGEIRLSRRQALRAGAVGVGVFGTGCTSDNPSSVASGNTTSARGGTPTATGNDEVPDTDDMELILEDRFRANELDTSTWRDKYPWDARTHNYDGYAAPENVFVEDDRLVLKAEDRPTKDREFTTGVVSAKEVFEPGYFEANIKIPPTVPGFWPAYWLTSASYHPPEIDIFEFFGADPEVYMTYHYANSEGEERKVQETWGGPNLSADFHTYSVDWDPPEKVVWYIDGIERFRYDGPHVSDESCYLILNFGIDRPGDPSPRSKDLPATYEVDWIRCWER
ncbi:glycoside hydrolase family 16 protein [Halopelagius fulvigenes]|uniref:Family 16 glycosylhydrolase n=1 Tax=Halopelagius fulvigenes TaxID=1198324 RepID=A0ABD5TY08_9EURY